MDREEYAEEMFDERSLTLVEQSVYADGASDMELVERMVAGDSTAVQELVTRYERKLIAYSQHIVNSEDLAKDICQEVFMKLIRRPPLSSQNGNLGPWLFRVAHNLSIDLWRRRKFEITGEELPEESMGRATPFNNVSLSHDFALLRELVGRLPNEYRQVVELRVYAEMPYKEIAETLGIPQGTALWRYHESIKLLGIMWRRHES
ncbi:MAG: RNA polymerase sigma factor [Victivallales bacterium]|nr:RNA polymerase sigma factor [Victivallales bacterium]